MSDLSTAMTKAERQDYLRIRIRRLRAQITGCEEEIRRAQDELLRLAEPRSPERDGEK